MSLYDIVKSFSYNNLSSNLLINCNVNTDFYSRSSDILNLTSINNSGIINIITSNSIGSLEYNNNSNITLKTTCNIIEFENGYLNCDGLANKNINLANFPTSTMNITKISNLFNNTTSSSVSGSILDKIFQDKNTTIPINNSIFSQLGDISSITQNGSIQLNNTYLLTKSLSNINLSAYISFISLDSFILGKGIHISTTNTRTIKGISVYAAHKRGAVEYIELYKNINIVPNSSNIYYFEFNQARLNIYTNEFIINIESLSQVNPSPLLILKHISISGESKFFEIQDSIDLKQKNILNCKTIDVDEIIMNGSICTNLSFNDSLVNDHEFDLKFHDKVLVVNVDGNFQNSLLDIAKLNALDFQRIDFNRIPYINGEGELITNSNYTIDILSNIHELIHNGETTNRIPYINESGALITNSNYTIDILSNIHELIHNGEPGIITTDGFNLAKYNNNSLYYFNHTNSNILANSNLYATNLQTDLFTLNGVDLSWDGAKLHYQNEVLQNEVYNAYSIYPPPRNTQTLSNLSTDTVTYSYSNNIIITVSITLDQLYNTYNTNFDYDENNRFFQSGDNFINGINKTNLGEFSSDKFDGDKKYIPTGYPQEDDDIYGFGITYLLNRYIYPKYVLISTSYWESSPRQFKIYGTSNTKSNLLYETNEFINFKQNAKNYIQLTSNIDLDYNEFSLYVQSINGSVDNGFCEMHGFAILGDDIINSTTLSYKSKYNEFIMNGKIGLNNMSPAAILSINNEPTNFLQYNTYNKNSLVHLNLSESDKTIQTNLEQQSILRMYRPCDNSNFFGNIVHHEIGAFSYTNSNIMTEYSIVLSQNIYHDIKWTTPLRMFSDNRVLINLTDLEINLVKEIQGIHIGNSITIYDTKNSSNTDITENTYTSNYTSIIASNLSDKQNIILPTNPINIISSNYVLTIRNVEGLNIHTEWQKVSLLSQNIILPEVMLPESKYKSRVLTILNEPSDDNMVIQTGWVATSYELLQNQFIFLGVSNMNIKEFNASNNPLIDDFLFQTNKIVIGKNTGKIKYSNINENEITFQGNMKGYGQIILDCLEDNHDFGSQKNSNAFLTNGNIYTTGSIYATTDITTDSDIRYKYNLSNIQNPAQIIKKLNGYTFNRNDTDLNQRFTGLIAQELQKVLPEAIYEKEDGKLRIFYGNLAGLFVETFKDIYNELDLIKKKI